MQFLNACPKLQLYRANAALTRRMARRSRAPLDRKYSLCEYGYG